METKVLLLLSFIVLSLAVFGISSPTIPQRSLREIYNKRRQLNYLKGLLQDLDDKLEKMEKRSCLMNIPGTDCDYRDITGIGKDHSIWMSKMAPGKKRRIEIFNGQNENWGKGEQITLCLGWPNSNSWACSEGFKHMNGRFNICCR